MNYYDIYENIVIELVNKKPPKKQLKHFLGVFFSCQREILRYTSTIPNINDKINSNKSVGNKSNL